MRTGIIPRVSICQFSTIQWTFQEDLVRYAAHGFDSVGIWRRKLEDIGAEEAYDLLYDSKMSVSSIHWAGGFTGDGQSFSDSIEDAIEAIQLASCVDANCLILHPGSRNGHTTKHAYRLLTSALKTLVPIAIDYGVKLALEPMINKQASAWTFMGSFDETINLAKRFANNSVGIVLDTYHVGFDSDVYEKLDQFVDHVELVQLADRKLLLDQTLPHLGHASFRMPLGTGEVPIEAWMSKLQRLGYTGQYEIEVHSEQLKDIDYFSLLDSTTDYFGDPKRIELLKLQSEIPNQKPSRPSLPLSSAKQRFADQ